MTREGRPNLLVPDKSTNYYDLARYFGINSDGDRKRACRKTMACRRRNVVSSNYRVNGFSKKLTAFVGLGISFGIAGFLLKRDNPSATPDRWASTVSSMISGRSNACSVLLADGRI